MNLIFHLTLIVCVKTCVTSTTIPFPWKEFFNFTEEAASDIYITDILCEGNATRCSCDDTCTETNMCCIDKYWKELQPINLTSYVTYMIEKSKFFLRQVHRLSEQPIVNPLLFKRRNLVIGSAKMMMVSSCEVPASDIDKQNCNDTLQSSADFVYPVLASNGLYYRNSYCAKCNFIKSYQVIDVKISCRVSKAEDTSAISENTSVIFQNSTKCNIIQPEGYEDYQYKGKDINMCKPIRQCSTDAMPSDICNAYAGTMSTSAPFMNYHCLLSCPLEIKNRPPCTTLQSWVNIIKFPRNDEIEHEHVTTTYENREPTYEDKIYCKTGKVLDIINTTKCMYYACASDYHLNGSHCKYISELSNITNKHDVTIPRLPSGNISEVMKAKIIKQSNRGITYKWQYTLATIQGYFSFIGTLLSIICYVGCLLVIFAKRKFKKLNVPKQLLGVLCVVLFISDLLFLLSNITRKSKVGCKISAIMLHFFLLLSHMTVAMIAYEFASTFRKTPVTRSTNNSKRFLLYSFISLTTALLITLVTVVLNELDPNIVIYGSNDICWIVHFNTFILVYILPAMLVYIFSICAVAYAVRNIHNVNIRSQSSMNKKEKYRYASKKLVIKLILYLGVLETLGIIQIHKNILSENELIFNSVFSTFYVVVRSLKGVFLCILVIINKKKHFFKSSIKKVLSITRKCQELTTAKSSYPTVTQNSDA